MAQSAICLSWIIALAAFLVFLVIHVLIFRYLRPKNRILWLHALCLAFLPLVGFATHAAYEMLATDGHIAAPSLAERQLNAWALLAFLYVGTLAFYAAVDHAIRARLSIELFKARGRPLPYSKLIESYAPRDAARRRIEQLALGGYLMFDGDKIRLTSKGRMLARFFSWAKDFFRIGLGG